ncbi:hypothetical protein Ancab_021267, partial [Ancistrocladus abbreviatus]
AAGRVIQNRGFDCSLKWNSLKEIRGCLVKQMETLESAIKVADFGPERRERHEHDWQVLGVAPL